MKTADFAFDLPVELIAQEPLPERSASILADATAVDPQAVRDMQDQMREQDEVNLVSR